ncbi:unnamed protein product [Notodromas monacha]|uniref:ADP-ribosylation factor n=1 Tax=Notodromas monacha TaxID=399045 RepID=A0A7R9BLT5_9CRUS|nr:unnamed protein product [Notodromas monacha]CAG0917031.1 unnamed protein product [Notodromas monacha]
MIHIQGILRALRRSKQVFKASAETENKTKEREKKVDSSILGTFLKRHILSLKMGLVMSRVWEIIFSSFKKPCRILMIGLDNAGKTTILYKMKLNELVTSIPTIGFNVECIDYKNLNMTIWDVGGQKTIRALWRHYYQNTQAVIYVIDSNDAERLAEAAEELHDVLRSDELPQDAVLLILANKQDLPNAKSISAITEALNLRSLRNRDWFVQATCAARGEGLIDGFEWLAKAINAKK